MTQLENMSPILLPILGMSAALMLVGYQDRRWDAFCAGCVVFILTVCLAVVVHKTDRGE